MVEFLVLFLTIYGALALSHILIQIWLGHLEYKRQSHKKFQKFHNNHYSSITVVVPSYNEEPEVLYDSIESIYNQKFKDLEIIIVDDGSSNFDELNEKVYKKFNHGRLRLIRSKKNVGKRNAQKLAFDEAKGDIIVTVDSDTILRSSTILNKIIRRFKDPKVGAVTGDVQVENKNKNLLTRMIGYRYWTAFHQERAAQSYFSVMMCCSGPFSAYRRDILEKVKERYVSQVFLGRTCTFGDDRHLTNLILEDGWKAVFDHEASVYTHVPENLRDYIKQQIRWNKSFYREMLWTLKFSHRHHIYMMYELIMQFILPFLLIAALAAMAYQAVFVDVNAVWKYLTILIGIALLRSLYGMHRTKDKGFGLFVIYGFIHVLLLIPTRLYALATINKTKWGTR